MLGGNPHPQPLHQWHGTSDRGTELAKNYIDDYGTKWLYDVTALTFVRWLFNHSRVMGERSQIAACREALQWEHDPDRRSVILERERVLQMAIDDQFSTELVMKRTDRHGAERYPWQTTYPLGG
ncbi:hypothetical protein D3C84_881330 [compost metagenome]